MTLIMCAACWAGGGEPLATPELTELAVREQIADPALTETETGHGGFPGWLAWSIVGGLVLVGAGIVFGVVALL